MELGDHDHGDICPPQPHSCPVAQWPGRLILGKQSLHGPLASFQAVGSLLVTSGPIASTVVRDLNSGISTKTHFRRTVRKSEWGLRKVCRIGRYSSCISHINSAAWKIAQVRAVNSGEQGSAA